MARQRSSATFADDGLNTLFDRCLIINKHTDNRIYGLFLRPPTRSPTTFQLDEAVDYGDRAGRERDHDEVGQYWRWTALAQD